jgi:hypothetical protein
MRTAITTKSYTAASKQPAPQVVFVWSEKIPTLGHNLALVSVLYSGEQPEITPHDEEPNKAKTTKGNIELT